MSFSSFRTSFAVVGLLLVFLPTVASACIEGLTYEKNVGQFKAEMSYNAYRLKSGQTVRFHFDLFNVSSDSYGPGDPVSYNTVEVTLKQGETVILTKSLKRAEFSETAFDYTLPKKNADYIMDIRFMKNGAELAFYSLPVRVGWGTGMRGVFGLQGQYKELMNGVTVLRNGRRI